MVYHLLKVLLVFLAPVSDAFTNTNVSVRRSRCVGQNTRLHEQVPAEDRTENLLSDASSEQLDIALTAKSSAGIDPSTELPSVFNAIALACKEFGIPFKHCDCQSNELPIRSEVIPGVLGRVILIIVAGLPPDIVVEDTELISNMKVYASEQIDAALSDGEDYKPPILLAFRSETSGDSLEDVIAKEVSDYGLVDGINHIKVGDSKPSDVNDDQSIYIPSHHIQIDGAFIDTISSPGDKHFDTSSVIVLDNLINPSLRKRLLNVVKGIPEHSTDEWNEEEFGPNPNRWERGGLLDVVNEGDTDVGSDGSCWGLIPEAIEDICFNRHPAICEFEESLSNLFSDFTVTKLPEAVFGDCISPLTANAPTHGDRFDYHIDADPLQVPPSPWADVFGRYPNRSKGKPRFVSCLLYLNDEWDAEWGAPTRFLDPPTQEEIDVMPRPGRCVIMDQDISHSVIAPNAEAGNRPRYSLVWKLILHPNSLDQDVSDLSCGRTWPEPEIVGSAHMS